jgi:hypothetical protein
MSSDERYQFWTELIEKASSSDSYYHGFNPRRAGAIQQRTGIPGVSLCFRLRGSYTQVTLTIENIGFERSVHFFEQLYQHRQQIEKGISVTIEWQSANEKTNTSRILATLQFDNSPSIEEHYELMIATMDEFREILLPYIKQLHDLK